MSLIIRLWNLAHGLSARIIIYFERRSPETLLELEREKLRSAIGKFNEGLVSHAAVSQRLITQVARGEDEVKRLTTRTEALISSGEREIAASCALQLKLVTGHLAEDRKQLEMAEESYRHLFSAREAAIGKTRAKIELVRRQIGDLKVKRALANIQGMANEMIIGIGSFGDSLGRLHEIVEEEREKASARVRVTGDYAVSDQLKEHRAEQKALAHDALAEFLATRDSAAFADCRRTQMVDVTPKAISSRGTN